MVQSFSAPYIRLRYFSRFFSIKNTKNTGVGLYFERAKINYFLFLFKMFLEIFKDMENAMDERKKQTGKVYYFQER